jgi:hypothetical protein
MRKHGLKQSNLLSILVIVAAVLSACTGGSSPRVWIDEPLNGSQHALGEITIRYHAASETGVRGFVLYVNGEEHSRDQSPDRNARIVTRVQSWMPPAAGQYTLQVVAYTSGREASEAATVQVTVGGVVPTLAPTEAAPGATSPPEPTLPAATAAPTEMIASPTDTPVSPAVTSIPATGTPAPPTNTSAPTSVPTSPPASTHTPPPVPTHTPPPAPTHTPPPPPTHTPPPPTSTPPPPPTNTPTLAPDTAGPEISDISESADPIYTAYPGGCSPTEVTITARATDPSGVDRLRIGHRIAGGEWEFQPMAAVGSGLYRVTLSSPAVPTALEYRIQARDTLGNQSNSAIAAVEVRQCTGD